MDRPYDCAACALFGFFTRLSRPPCRTDDKSLARVVPSSKNTQHLTHSAVNGRCTTSSSVAIPQCRKKCDVGTRRTGAKTVRALMRLPPALRVEGRRGAVVRQGILAARISAGARLTGVAFFRAANQLQSRCRVVRKVSTGLMAKYSQTAYTRGRKGGMTDGELRYLCQDRSVHGGETRSKR